jgi:hypothetical protein
MYILDLNIINAGISDHNEALNLSGEVDERSYT